MIVAIEVMTIAQSGPLLSYTACQLLNPVPSQGGSENRQKEVRGGQQIYRISAICEVEKNVHHENFSFSDPPFFSEPPPRGTGFSY